MRDQNITLSHSAFTCILPQAQENKRARVAIFISKNATQLVCTSRPDMINDVDILALSISDSDLPQTLLLNVYNEKSQKDNSNEYTVERKLTQL